MPANKPTARAMKPLRTPEFIALVSCLTSLTALSIDALLPAMREMGDALGVENNRDLHLLVTLFFAGMVIGELGFGPLSDATGRKKAILTGLVIFVVGTWLAMQANTFHQVLIGRFIQGIGVSGPKIATRALIRDLYEGDEMARILSFAFSLILLVPMLAPAIGQMVLAYADWRAIFYLFFLIAVVCTVWLAWRQPETLPKNQRLPLQLGGIARNTLTCLRDRRAMTLTAAAGCIFGAFLVYLGNAQAVFLDVYSISNKFVFYFAALALATGLAAFTNAQLVRRFGAYRLSFIALLAMLFFSCVFLTGSWVADGRPSLGFFLGSCFVLFACQGILMGNLSAMAMHTLGHVAGLGSSIVASVSSLIAVCMALTIGRLYDQTVLILCLGFLFASATAIGLLISIRHIRAAFER